jgi:uncharacterized protein (DUF58 family)
MPSSATAARATARRLAPAPRRRRPLAAALFTAFVLAGGSAADSVLLAQVGVLLAAGLIIAALWARLGSRGLQVAILPSRDRLTAGETLTVDVELRNRLRLPRPRIDLRVHSDLGPTIGWTAALSPNGRSQLRTTIRCALRGVYALGPADVASPDPLEIFEGRRAAGDRREVVVYPPCPRLPHFVLPGGRRGASGARGRVAGGPIVAGVREYTPGDPPQRIHWPLSLRQSRLVVRTLEDDPDAGVCWIALDLCAADQHPDPAALEAGVIAAAALAQHALEQGRPVGFLASGSRQHWLPPVPGRGQLRPILEALAYAQPRGTTPLSRLLVSRLGVQTRNGLLIAITAAPTGVGITGRMLGLQPSQIVLVRLTGERGDRPAAGRALPGDLPAQEYVVSPTTPIAEALASGRAGR